MQMSEGKECIQQFSFPLQVNCRVDCAPKLLFSKHCRERTRLNSNLLNSTLKMVLYHIPAQAEGLGKYTHTHIQIYTHFMFYVEMRH